MVHAKRLPLTLAIAAFAAAPARAAFCGEPFDIAPIVKLTIATYPKVSHSSQPIDRSSIKSLDVNGTYAYSATVAGSQRLTFYWEKPTGTWHFVSANRVPADWPKPLVDFFAGDDCRNIGAIVPGRSG